MSCINRNNIIAITALTASTLVLAITLQQSFKNVNKSIFLKKGKSTMIKLLQGEREGLIHICSINTITFFDGSISIVSLREKVKEIVTLNPWLRSRLVNSAEFGETAALYPTEYNPDLDTNDFFYFLVDTVLTKDMDYSTMSNYLSKVMVKKGTECIGKNEPLFKVSLIEMKNSKEYALVVSLSHVLGDGHTFYRLYEMLDINKPAVALNPIRHHNFMDNLRSSNGKKLIDWMNSPLLVAGLLCTVIFGAIPKAAAYNLNNKTVENIKSNYHRKNSNADESLSEYGAVPFISTNDIITSWFFKQCNSKYGMMAINFRNRLVKKCCIRFTLIYNMLYVHRLEGYTDDDAGNYENIILYNSDDYSCPNYIRQSISTFRSKSNAVPSIYESLTFNISVVTNWSSFYRDITLSEDKETAPLSVQQSLHMPLMNLSDIIFRDLCIIFNTKKDQLAVMCFCRNINMEHAMDINNKEQYVADVKVMLDNRII